MHIVNAALADMDIFQRWALAEGWQPGSGDVQAFHHADPEGFLVGVEGGEPIATISLVRYSDTYAFMGYFVVSPDHRGKGRGRQIWDDALSRSPQGTLGLDGVLDQIPTYEQSGFVGAHLTQRFTGLVDEVLNRVEQGSSVEVDAVERSSEHFEQLVGYDARHVPAPRRRFLEGWLAPGSLRRSYVALDGGEIVGWATARPAMPKGTRIGPLFARDTQVASALLSACLVPLRGSQDEVAIDVPEVNEAAADFVKELGMRPGFATARMYRGPAPSFKLSEVFGNTTLELG